MMIRPLLRTLVRRADAMFARRPLVVRNPRSDDAFTSVIGFKSKGAVAAGTSTTGAMGRPGNEAIGDIVVMFVCSKPETAVPTDPANWTKVAQGTGGAGSAGQDSGLMVGTMYKRVVDQAYIDEGAATVTVTCTGANVSMGGLFCIQKNTPGTSWNVATAKGASNTPGVDWSATMDGDPGIRAGDFLLAASCWNNDGLSILVSAPPNAGWFIPGVTAIANHTEGNGGGATANGNDLRWDFRMRVVRAGVSTGVGTWLMTMSGSTASAPAGPTLLARLRAV